MTTQQDNTGEVSMPGQKVERSKKRHGSANKTPKSKLYVVVITNSDLTQLVCGGFESKRAAEKFRKKVPEIFTSATTQVMAPERFLAYL